MYQRLAMQAEPRRIQYGKAGTADQVNAVVGFVLQHYQFTSYPEFNAILHGYNLSVGVGKPGSRLNENGGLVYQVLKALERRRVIKRQW